MASINWKKTLIIVADVILAVYLVLAVTAFNTPAEKATVCTEVKINIEEDIIPGFLNADEVRRILEHARLYPMAQPMDQVNVRLIEETLRKSPFVESAECHKTQSGHVCITLRQRMPVIHVMANNGDNYYLDAQGNIMPETRYVSDLPIATGWISRTYARKQLPAVASTIVGNKFWRNQVEQVNILFNGGVELVPRIGDHIVYLGAPTGTEGKLERLRKFYLYGLSQAGWNKYSYINLEFDNQIICKKKTLKSHFSNH